MATLLNLVAERPHMSGQMLRANPPEAMLKRLQEQRPSRFPGGPANPEYYRLHIAAREGLERLRDLLARFSGLIELHDVAFSSGV
jgi:hypothetical protein